MSLVIASKMASKLTRPLARTVQQGRMLSAAAQASPAASDSKIEIKKLPNGLTLGAIESASPVARVAVIAKAGSRYENGDILGISHLLRHAAKLKTSGLSQLGITRGSQQLGGDITCEGTREYIYYKSAVTRNMVPDILDILKEVTNRQAFRRWEVEDLQHEPNTLKLDLAVLAASPNICAVELLHQAAFRDTLGRSLYMPEFMLGKLNHEDLQAYAESRFSAGNMAVVGLGVDMATLERSCYEIQPYESAAPAADKAVYKGGEIMQNQGGALSYVAVAMEGPSLGGKDLMAGEVLKHVLGVGPAIKYSPGTAAAPLAKATAAASANPHYVSAFSASYSDSGLFGFTAGAHYSDIGNVAQAGAAALQSALGGAVTDADVARAKAQLKASILTQLESGDAVLTWVGEQALAGEAALSPGDVAAMVDQVTTADVKAVGKAIASSKPSLAAAGNTSTVPYLDQLFK